MIADPTLALLFSLRDALDAALFEPVKGSSLRLRRERRAGRVGFIACLVELNALGRLADTVTADTVREQVITWISSDVLQGLSDAASLAAIVGLTEADVAARCERRIVHLARERQR